LSVSYVINETNFHDVFNNFNKTILDAYRRVCLNLGKKFNIDTDKIAQELARVVELSGMSVAEANAYYRSMGFTPVYE
jgi:hypothetical protein